MPRPKSSQGFSLWPSRVGKKAHVDVLAEKLLAKIDWAELNDLVREDSVYAVFSADGRFEGDHVDVLDAQEHRSRLEPGCGVVRIADRAAISIGVPDLSITPEKHSGGPIGQGMSWQWAPT